MISIAVLGLLLMVAMSSYQSYLERVDTTTAISDIKIMSAQITDYNLTYASYPDSLAEVQLSMNDPWGNPYEYLAIEGKKKSGHTRKDHSLVPINSDFDLYSIGKDGKSSPPLTAKGSKDDIVRGNNGRFIGLGSDF